MALNEAPRHRPGGSYGPQLVYALGQMGPAGDGPLHPQQHTAGTLLRERLDEHGVVPVHAQDAPGDEIARSGQARASHPPITTVQGRTDHSMTRPALT